MTTQIIPVQDPFGGFDQVVKLVVDGLTSDHSKRAYRNALADFRAFMRETGREFSKASVNGYRAELIAADLAPSTVNQRLTAIRRLALEAADNGLLDPAIAAAVERVKGVKMAGRRSGNWLSKEQAQELIRLPDGETLGGLRDRAVLAVLIGGGLRRSELAGLQVDDIQMREGRWLIVDLIGKGGRVRSVPIPSWTKVAIDEWIRAAGIESGTLFLWVNKGDRLAGDRSGISPQAVADVVKKYGAMLGQPSLAAHDLRRTWAKLAHKGGAGLDQIQLSLGHASIQTTERYLGVEQNLTTAPCDVLGLELR